MAVRNRHRKLIVRRALAFLVRVVAELSQLDFDAIHCERMLLRLEAMADTGRIL